MPAIATKATPAVIRLSIRVAATRARIPFSMDLSFSMVLTLARAAGRLLWAGCELAEK